MATIGEQLSEEQRAALGASELDADVKMLAGEKMEVPKDAIRYTVQQRVEKLAAEFPAVWWFTRTSDWPIAPWWSPQRDIDLREFVKEEGNDILAGAVSSMVKKFRAMNWVVDGPAATVEWAQDLLGNAEFGKGWSSLIGKTIEDYLCLYATSKVWLGGDRRGKTKTIRDIVQDQDEGPVLSVDKLGRIVERRILEWHKTPLGSRRWWWISLANGMHGHGGTPGGLYLTEDHPVLTKDGWLLARDVKVGMQVATADPMPSEAQMQFLVGTLLGDASLSWVRKNGLKRRAILRFSHSAKQEDWLDHKVEALAGFSWTPKTKAIREGNFGSGESVQLNSHASMGLVSLREIFYPKGKKIVPRELIAKYFGPLMMAAWYLDDGSIHHPKTKSGILTRETATIATHGFTKADTEWLCGFLTAKGLPCRVQRTAPSGKAYYYLHFNVDGAEALFRFIAAYVPSFMRYKLPNAIGIGYDPVTWMIHGAAPTYDEVVASEEKDPRSKYGGCQVTYHIGVEETGDFVAANMVVHNTTDNGAFWEVIGKGSPDKPLDGLPVGVAHLDSTLCTLTGDPNFPVVFRHPKDGKPHKLHATRVVHMVDMESPNETMNGVGFCATSRVIASSYLLLQLSQYKREKLSDLPQAGLLILNNVVPQKWEDAKQEYERERRNLGNEMWANIMTLIGVDPAQPADAKFLSFSNLPDHFDEAGTITTYINVVALAMGIDAREFWPVSSGALGTAAESLVMHQKAKGKGIGDLISTIERAINWHLFPKRVSFSFDFTDDEEDAQRAAIEDQKAVTILRMFAPDPAGETVATRMEVRQMLADNVDYFNPEFLEMDITEEEQREDVDRDEGDEAEGAPAAQPEPGEEEKRYNPSQPRLAAGIRAEAERREPEITKAFASAVGGAGGEMAGLEHRLKSEGSLARKVAQEAAEDGVLPGEVTIKDAVRYTAVFGEGDYGRGVIDTHAALAKKGWTPHDHALKNYWQPGDDYDGYNCVFQDKDGFLVELQFHTPESVRVKEEVAHPLYELARTLPPGPERTQLVDRMREAWWNVRRPAGWMALPGVMRFNS